MLLFVCVMLVMYGIMGFIADAFIALVYNVLAFRVGGVELELVPQATPAPKNEEIAQAQDAIGEALKQVDQGGGVLILTDMFGGTPTNISLTFLEPGRVEIITGINLPMLIKFLNMREQVGLDGVAEQLKAKGQRSIQVASELLGDRLARPRKD